MSFKCCALPNVLEECCSYDLGRYRVTYSEGEVLHLFRGERHRDVVAGWSVCGRGRE